MAEPIDDLIAGLETDDQDVLLTVRGRLEQRAAAGLTPEESAALLRAAGRAWPKIERSVFQAPGALVWAVTHSPHDSDLPIAREIYAGLDKSARIGVLRLLANLGTREAEQAIVDLAMAHRDEEPGIWFAWGMHGGPRHVDVFFPRVLDLLGHEAHSWGVVSLLVSAREEGAVAPRDLDSYGDALVAVAREQRRKLKRRQRPEPGPWLYGDDYSVASAEASALLDLLGHCGGKAVVKELRVALTYVDPRLHAWAVAALVRLDEELDPREIGRAAERAETRRIVARALQEKGRLDELPEHLRAQPALAEAEMVDWLSHPSELDRPPDEISLEAVVDAGAHRQVYVFRFRDGDEWLAGIAGPYPSDGPPAIDGGGATFSDFEPWDSRTPEQHAQAIIDSLPPT
jgi:hypothetical protein